MSEAKRKTVDLPSINKPTIWIYGSVSLPLAMLGYPLGVWIPRLYTTEMGLTPTAIGIVIFLAAIFDAVSDPVAGHFSDKWETRWGRRKPWLAIGLPLYAFAVWMLLNPEPGVSVIYLAIFFILLRTSTTIFGLPYAAWGAELSAEYQARTIIQSVREKYVLTGLIAASMVVLVSEEVFNRGDAGFVLSNFSIVILTLLPLTAFLVLWRVPEVPTYNAPHVPFFSSLKLMYKNKLFFRLLVIELLIAGGENFRNTLSLFFVQDYIGAPSVGRLYVLYFGVGLMAIPVWDRIAKIWGKHNSLAVAMVFVSIISIACFMLDYGQVTEFYVLFALKGFCFGAFAYLPRAMLADVVDVDTIRSGAARPASYFAILGFMTKCAASFGGLSLPMLDLVGYSVAPGATHSATELMWLGILYAWVPTSVFVVALYLSVTWPLTEQVHEKVRRILAKRYARQVNRGQA